MKRSFVDKVGENSGGMRTGLELVVDKVLKFCAIHVKFSPLYLGLVGEFGVEDGGINVGIEPEGVDLGAGGVGGENS